MFESEPVTVLEMKSKHQKTNEDIVSPSPVSTALPSPINSSFSAASSQGTSDPNEQQDPTLLFALDEELNDDDDGNVPTSTKSWSQNWTNLVRTTHAPILFVLQFLSSWAARHPRWTVSSIAIFSLGLLAFAVSRGVPVETGDQFSPRNSAAVRQSSYLYGGTSGFRGRYRYFSILFHAGIDEETGTYRDILGRDFIDKSFQVMEAVQNTQGYNKTCTQRKVKYQSPYDGRQDCEIYGVTRFWNHNITAFREDNDVAAKISQNFFADGQPAVKSYIFGRYNETDYKIINRLESANLIFYLPAGSVAKGFEKYALETVLELRDQWRNDYIQIEVQAETSLSNEFARTITDDIPLVAVIFIVMSIFTALALSRWQSVHSRGLLGVGAVVSVLLSIATGFGVMFLTGVPFSNLTQILPFIIFGIGLDDAFIVIGAFERTNPKGSTLDRVEQTIDDIGLSITLTTLTSAVAFGLGCLSSVYSVYWLCLYAMPVIIIVFLYTMTFFVALVALDEHRISQRRRDCFVCLRGNGDSDDSAEPSEHIVSKAVVLVGFFVLFINCAISASKFTEEFNFKEALPRDSYVLDYANIAESSSDTGLSVEPLVYFRYVDFGDTGVREQMRSFVDDLAESEYFDGPPEVFWVDFFEFYLALNVHIQNMTFNEQIQSFLSIKAYNDLFGSSLGIDDDGNVIGSRVRMRMIVDTENANDQTAALAEQRRISQAQPINQDRPNDLAFFCYDGVFKLWEFLEIARHELMITTFVSIAAVSLVALVFIPHWSAVVFVFPLICVLFVNLIGLIQWAGLHLNPVSYVSLAMSIGLLVDFVMHILFRYYEVSGNRHEKTVNLLRTMGASILLGGTTTFLGIIPLMFSVSDVFITVFYTFFGIVVLGMSHGLILLPTLLSIFGPEETVSLNNKKLAIGNKDEYPDRFEINGRGYAMETNC